LRSAPGGKVEFQINAYNPGPYQASNLYVHVWVGSGIADPSGDKFLPEVDTRFPRLTTPHFSGLISTAVLHGDFL
jgi:hypothetical protein